MVRYRIECPSGKPDEHTKIFLRLDNGAEIPLPDVTRLVWSLGVDSQSYAEISVINVRLGPK